MLPKFISLVALAAGARADDELAYRAWVASHGKVYDEARLAVFSANMKRVDELNADPHDGATYGLAEFADLSVEEFAAARLLPKRAPPALRRTKTPELATPDSYDWRPTGAVSPVRNQGSLGTCWIFSAAQNLEGQLAIKEQKNASWLSVEQVLECDATANATSGQADCGMFGGWPWLAFQYVIEAGGLRAEEDMPYCAGLPAGECYPCMATGYDIKYCGDHRDL